MEMHTRKAEPGVLAEVEEKQARLAMIETFQKRVGGRCVTLDEKRACAMIRTATRACKLSMDAVGKWIRFREGQTESPQDVVEFEVGEVVDAVPVFMSQAEAPVKIKTWFDTPVGKRIMRVADVATVARAVKLDLPHWVVTEEGKPVDA